MTNLFGLLQAVAQTAQQVSPPGGGAGGPPPGFSYKDALMELIRFVGSFLAIGAIGFRFGIVRRVRAMSDDARTILRADNAALIGILGVLLLALNTLGAPFLTAIADNKSFAEALPNNLNPLEFKLAMLALAFIGFAVVRMKPSMGWGLAAIGVVCVILQPLYTGRNFSGKVNAVHVLAAATWLGTLLVLTLVGIRGLIRSTATGVQRAELVADLVNSFSPLALTASTIVAITGATTAWLHLKRISALWTTSYGIALMVKLVLVLVVVVLGAWNWKRVRPSLGTEGTEHTIRRSATMELTFAALVLLATSVLVTLPSPR
ncbi:MAG TPA: CopD family protein [Gemmatimonadaceae bacterium]|nr:CopD family protein [Gemmatimonadaceae bacterium]